MQTFEELEQEREALEREHRQVLFSKDYRSLTPEEKAVADQYGVVVSKIADLVADMDITTNSEDKAGIRWAEFSKDHKHHRSMTAEEAVQKRREVMRILTKNPKTSVRQIMMILKIGRARATKWKNEHKSGWR